MRATQEKSELRCKVRDVVLVTFGLLGFATSGVFAQDGVALKKTLTTGLALAVFLAGALVATAAQAEDGKFLADRHVARGMTCESCHTKDMKVKPSTKYLDLDVCTDCHGDYTAMIKKTDGKYETNPHGQHEGALPCTECHKGHKEGVNYCGDCHNFEFKAP